ncbi:hypothetical protein IAI51_03185 [Pseudomonas sp. N40(2020)]|uniref:hypothetical protein n=1 Tax=Pseudomonas sp. N40(2020) TaxID=2767798 RepID=UPI0016574C37|nr:hypothetical protein [Pseudomonas sp. N40(2020)]MBC8995532.1 hypothetical protein [Pseudomonas sp. N40(2020)]
MAGKKSKADTHAADTVVVIKGILKAEVDGESQEFPAFYLEVDEGSVEVINAAFGVRGETYISLSNGNFPLVSYNASNASIPWEKGGELKVSRDPVSGRYSGGFTAQFHAVVPPGIPKAVKGIFEVWEES